MDKSNDNKTWFFNGIKCLLKGIKRFIFLIMAAIIIGFSNVFYNELRMVNDTKNFDEQEQVMDAEDPKD